MPISAESEKPGKGKRDKIGKEPMLSSGIETLTRNQIIARLGNICSGWNDTAGKILNIPEEMFTKKTQSAEIFSRDRQADPSEFIAFFHFRGQLPKANDLTIMAYETSGNAYIVIYDPGKRILFRDQISSYHSKSRNNWEEMEKLMQNIEGRAGKGEIAVYDNVVGSSRIVKS
ncbi:hypothetical protein JXA56_00940 [Candidatus Micrarchaeota archaeon]|nr:hypothetical protein [Candidatus Micrarchaeota archaeon]